MVEIPGYTLLRPLGQGGMGVVYLALQQSLRREVALKVFSPVVAHDAIASERFLREAHIAANLHHPHIVPIYDVGQYQGTAYIAMEFEPGGTVAPAAGDRYATSAALRSIRDIANALDYAHGQGVVHRDIKPENILRRADGTCLLSDFGIARVIEKGPALTHEGTSIGTPQYMSPEQLRGDKVDGRADLYSLGVVLYQLLTGELPYTGSDGWAIGMQHMSAEIPRLPPELARLQPLLDGLMAKSTDARPQTGAEVVRWIDALLAGATPAVTVSLAAASSKSRRLTVWHWLKIGTVCVMLVAGAAALWELRSGHSRVGMPVGNATTTIIAKPAIASIAVLPFENLSADKDNAYFASGIQDEILTQLAKIGALKVISRTSSQHYVSSPENLPEIARQLGVTNIVEGSVQKAGDSVRINVQLIQASTDTHLWAETYDRKLDNIFSIQSEVATAIAQALQATLTRDEQHVVALKPTSNAAAYDAFLRGLSYEQRTTWAVDDALRAQDYFSESVRLDPDFADAWRHLVQVRSLMYWNSVDRTPVALANMRQAAATVARLRPDSGDAWLALGYYQYRGLRDFQAALTSFERARVRLPNDAGVLSALSLIERRLGRMPAALAYLQQAEQLDPRNPQWPQSIGRHFDAIRHFPEARAAYDRVLDLVPGDVNILALKIGTYQAEGDLQSAQNLLATLPPPGSEESPALDAQRTQYLLLRRYDLFSALCTLPKSQAAAEAKPADVLDGYNCIGSAQRLQGNAVAAKATYQKMLAIAKRRSSEIEDRSLAHYFSLAYAGLGDKVSAIREAERAVALNQGDAVFSPDAELQLALVHTQFGDTDAAIALLTPLLKEPFGLTPAELRLYPDWDPIRKDPRFQKLSTEDKYKP